MARGTFGSSWPQEVIQASSVVGGLSLWLLLMLSHYSTRRVQLEKIWDSTRNTASKHFPYVWVWLNPAFNHSQPTHHPATAGTCKPFTDSICLCPRQGPDYSCCCFCTGLPGTGSPASIATVSGWPLIFNCLSWLSGLRLLFLFPSLCTALILVLLKSLNPRNPTRLPLKLTPICTTSNSGVLDRSPPPLIQEEEASIKQRI